MCHLSQALQYRRYRAPREDRAALVEPPFSEVGRLVGQNVQLHARASYDFQGRSLSKLTAQARAELVAEARRWTAAYRTEAGARAEGLIFLAGHQPELFHPGVWLKNFALGTLARQHGATAVNLLIDSDTVKHTSLRTPGGSAAHPTVEAIPFDRPEPRVPFEERQVVDPSQFQDFGRRVTESMALLLGDPLVRTYWPLVLERLREGDGLGTCLARARHVLEGRWGLETLEVPQSWVCRSESFSWFTAHLLAQLPRFREVHNQALAEYRRLHKLRSEAQPLPDLAADGPWLEAPLWAWSSERPERRRLFARQTGREVLLSDRQGMEIGLPLGPESDGGPAVEKLQEFQNRGVKIRSRALITTLWARLVLGDLFLHGIGGAKYDQVTDLLMERFFGLPAPGILVLSATLHLPIVRPGQPQEQPRPLSQQLRDLSYHPEWFLRAEEGGSGEIQRLIEAKTRWIHTPPTPDNARLRWQSIRRINQALEPWVADRRRRLVELQAMLARRLRAESILTWREYGFCLYPQRTLLEFFQGLLPKPP
jgi:hypothetical protein